MSVLGRLFGTDGVRGVANLELTAELAYKLGQAGAYVLTSETKHTPKIWWAWIQEYRRYAGGFPCCRIMFGGSGSGLSGNSSYSDGCLSYQVL